MKGVASQGSNDYINQVTREQRITCETLQSAPLHQRGSLDSASVWLPNVCTQLPLPSHIHQTQVVHQSWRELIFLWIYNKMFKSCDSLLINLICFVTSSTLRLFMSNVMLNSIFSISIASSVCCRLSGGSSSVGMPSKPALAVSRVPEQHRPSVASKWFPWITDKTQVINRFFRFA